MAEEAAGGSFDVFDFGFDFGAEPGVVGHFVRGDAFTPMTTWRSAMGLLHWRGGREGLRRCAKKLF